MNANPQRLDLDWRHLITAKKKGVRIAINPDIHQLSGFDFMAFGIRIARKGWLESGDCINCLSSAALTTFLHDLRGPQKGKSTP